MDIYFKKISSRFVFYTNSAILKKRYLRGELVEWSKAPHWKCGVPQGTEGSNPSLSAIFILKKMKMANEAARLLFTRRQPLFTQKAQPFLHIFTKTEKPCLLVRHSLGRRRMKTLLFITLVKPFRCAPLVKFSPCGSKDGVPLLKRFAYTAASRLDFFILDAGSQPAQFSFRQTLFQYSNNHFSNIKARKKHTGLNQCALSKVLYFLEKS